MNKPALYEENNHLERSDVEEVLKEFASKFKWRSDGRDSVLDAGCGPGDATLELLLPILPPNFERLVAVDISEEMITYARKMHIHPKVSFEQFNLEVELEKQSLNEIESFDHITSFFCFMCLDDYRTGVKNFYKLLKPGGDMLLVFLTKNTFYDIVREQSQNARWAPYLYDVNKFIAKYQNAVDPAKEFRDLLVDSGFKDCDIKLHDKAYVFDEPEKMKGFLHAVCRFFDRIRVDEKQAYLDDTVERFVGKGCALDDFTKDPKTCRIKFPYQLLVAYARK